MAVFFSGAPLPPTCQKPTHRALANGGVKEERSVIFCPPQPGEKRRGGTRQKKKESRWGEKFANFLDSTVNTIPLWQEGFLTLTAFSLLHEPAEGNKKREFEKKTQEAAHDFQFPPQWTTLPLLFLFLFRASLLLGPSHYTSFLFPLYSFHVERQKKPADVTGFPFFCLNKYQNTCGGNGKKTSTSFLRPLKWKVQTKKGIWSVWEKLEKKRSPEDLGSTKLAYVVWKGIYFYGSPIKN